MENSISDYIGLAVVVVGVAIALWFFWGKITDKFK